MAAVTGERRRDDLGVLALAPRDGRRRDRRRDVRRAGDEAATAVPDVGEQEAGIESVAASELASALAMPATSAAMPSR